VLYDDKSSTSSAAAVANASPSTKLSKSASKSPDRISYKVELVGSVLEPAGSRTIEATVQSYLPACRPFDPLEDRATVFESQRTSTTTTTPTTPDTSTTKTEQKAMPTGRQARVLPERVTSAKLILVPLADKFETVLSAADGLGWQLAERLLSSGADSLLKSIK